MSFLDSFLTYDSISAATSKRPQGGKSGHSEEGEVICKRGWRRRLWRLTNNQLDQMENNEEAREPRRLTSLGNLAPEGDPLGLEMRQHAEKKDKQDTISSKQGKKLRKLASVGSLSLGGEKGSQKLSSIGSLSSGGGRMGQDIRRRLASSRDRLHSIIK